MAKIIRTSEGIYMFDAGDGSEHIECKVWNEKAKANDKHPEGKPHIKLPKDNCTNRQYFSEDKFLELENGTNEVEVEVKEGGPRVLGASGVKQSILKYLDVETAKEYEELVNSAVDAYKEAKGSTKKKKIDDFTEEELMSYINDLKTGKKPNISKGPKSFLDMFSDEQYDRYNEILALAAENKANAPKAVRGPLTQEEKEARAKKRIATEISKAEKLLAMLQGIVPTSDEDEVQEETIEGSDNIFDDNFSIEDEEDNA